VTRSQIRSIKILFAILGLGLWFGSSELYIHYAKTRPRQPDPATGRMYIYNQAGGVFYLNAKERRRWRCLMAAGVACIALMAGSYFYEERLISRASPPEDKARRPYS
jgi:hypothetical protein